MKTKSLCSSEMSAFLWWVPNKYLWILSSTKGIFSLDTCEYFNLWIRIIFIVKIDNGLNFWPRRHSMTQTCIWLVMIDYVTSSSIAALEKTILPKDLARTSYQDLSFTLILYRLYSNRYISKYSWDNLFRIQWQLHGHA